MVAALVINSSCTKNFQEYNTDPNGTSNALPEQLLAPTLVDLLRYNMLRNRNFNNELMQVTVDISDAEGRVFRYDFRPSWADYTWNGWFSQLTNLKDLYITASDELSYNSAYMAVSLICQSWVSSLLTDTYGDVPYSEANKAKSDQIYEPKFDKQEDIYRDMFAKLEEANTLLKNSPSTESITADSDPIFKGDKAKWRKFGNSLYLRLLMRVSGKEGINADAIAKINEIAETNTGAYPIMANNDDSAVLRWTGVAPYISPYITNVRNQDFRSPAIASFFIDHLRDWADPRLDISTYGTNSVNRWGITQGSAGFSGVPSGYPPGGVIIKMSDFYSIDQKPESLQNEPLAGMIMNYAELQFILSEAAAKGWISKSAQDYYYKGVLNSITLWLPNWPNPTAEGTSPSGVTITDPEFDDYISTAELTWDEAASLDDKMEKIHLQKYYALFLNDFQQWFEFRRTGHPVLPKGAGLKNNGEMPSRLNYPVYVQSTNPTNYKAAVAEQGPDLISTKVWWQKP